MKRKTETNLLENDSVGTVSQPTQFRNTRRLTWMGTEVSEL